MKRANRYLGRLIRRREMIPFWVLCRAKVVDIEALALRFGYKEDLDLFFLRLVK